MRSLALIFCLLVALASRARADDSPTFTTVVRGTPKSEPVQITTTVEDARRVAGTQGDPLRVVQNLPGVARASFGSGQLVVWGAAPNDTRIYIDDVEVPALYHLGGFRSTINSELVRSISFAPGGFGAAYGRGVGGLVELETRTLPSSGVHGYVGADLLDASAYVFAALSRRVNLAIAGRYSYLDRIAAHLVSAQAGDYVAIPRYDDYQVKLTIALRDAESVSMLFLAANDRLHRAIASVDPASARTDENETSMYRFSVRYSRLIDEDTRVTVTPFAGYDSKRQSAVTGAQPTYLDVASIRYGMRGSYRRRIVKPMLLTLGVDILGSHSTVNRYGSLTVPPREGDPYVFGQPPGTDLAADRYHIDLLEAAPYATAELTFGRVTIQPGFRLSAVLVEGDRGAPKVSDTPVLGFSRLQWAADPRLAVSVRAHAKLTFTASAGLYHQAPELADLSPVFGNPLLGLQSAVHVTFGATTRITDTLTVELVGYYKRLDHLVSRSELATPTVTHALMQDGIGRSYGGQLTLRQQVWRGLSGWIAYSISRSERRDHADTRWRLFDFDQTQALTIVASYDTHGWSFGARFRYTSGYPRTTILGAFYDSQSDAFEPRFGAINTIHLPPFYALDLRLEKTLRWKRVAWNLYLDVQNVTYRRNPEEIVYNADFSRRGYITGLPTLAVAGTKVIF